MSDLERYFSVPEALRDFDRLRTAPPQRPARRRRRRDPSIKEYF